MFKDISLTYISLFSLTGAGYNGFKETDVRCVATNELIGKMIKSMISVFENVMALERENTC